MQASQQTLGAFNYSGIKINADGITFRYLVLAKIGKNLTAHDIQEPYCMLIISNTFGMQEGGLVIIACIRIQKIRSIERTLELPERACEWLRVIQNLRIHSGLGKYDCVQSSLLSRTIRILRFRRIRKSTKSTRILKLRNRKMDKVCRPASRLGGVFNYSRIKNRCKWNNLQVSCFR